MKDKILEVSLVIFVVSLFIFIYIGEGSNIYSLIKYINIISFIPVIIIGSHNFYLKFMKPLKKKNKKGRN